MSSVNIVVDLCSSDNDSDSSSGSSSNRGRARLQTRRAAARQRVRADTASDSDGGSTDASTDCSQQAATSLGVLPQKRKLSRISPNLPAKPQDSRRASRGGSQDKKRSVHQLGLQAVGQGLALREVTPVLATADAGSKRSDRAPAQGSMRKMSASKSATRVSQQSSSAWTTDDSDGLDFLMGDLLGNRKRRRIQPGTAGKMAAHGDRSSPKMKTKGMKSAGSTLRQGSIAGSISGTGLARGGANARASSRPPSGRPRGSQDGALAPTRKPQINVDDPWDISFSPVTLDQLCLHKSRVSSVREFLSQQAWQSAPIPSRVPSARAAASTDALALGEFPSFAVPDSPTHRRQAHPLSEQPSTATRGPGTAGKESSGPASSDSPVTRESKGGTAYADDVDDDDLLALAEAMEEADEEDLLALAEAMEEEQEQGTGHPQPPGSLAHKQSLQDSAGSHPGRRGAASMASSGGGMSRPRSSRQPRPSTRLLVLFGPPGTGKSTAVRVAAEQAGLEVSTWEDTGSLGGYSRSLLGGMAGDQGNRSRDGKVSVTEDFCGTVRAACAYRSLSLHGLDSEPLQAAATVGSSGDSSSNSSSSSGAAPASVQAPKPVSLHQEVPSARVLLIEDLPPAVHKSLRWGGAPSSRGPARSVDGVGEDVLEQVRSALRLAARRARCPVVLVLSSLGEDCERPTRRAVEQLLGPGLRDAPGVRILESPPVPDTRMRAALRRVVACARGASLQLPMGSGKKNAKSCPARRYLTGSDNHAIEMAIASAGGDLRHAIASIQMAERRGGGGGKGSHRPLAGQSLTSKGRRRVRDIFDDSAGGQGAKPEPGSGYASSSGAESAAGRSGSDREGQSRFIGRSSSSSSGAWCERDDFLDGLHSIGKLLRGRRLDAGEGTQGSSRTGKGKGLGSLLQPSMGGGYHASSAAAVMREATRGRMDGLPAQYLSGFADHPAANAARAPLEFSPDSVAQSSVLQGGTLLAFLQDGAPSHFASIEELAACFEVYGDADAVFHRSGGGGSRQGSRAARATAVDGGSSYLGHNLGHSLASRAAAAHCVQRANVGFQPIRRPQSLSCAAVARRNAEWASARLAGLSADFDAASLAGPIDRPVEYARADSTDDRPTAAHDLASGPGGGHGGLDRAAGVAGGTAVGVLSNRGVSFQERASVLVRREGSLRRGSAAAAAASGLDRAGSASSGLRPRAAALLRALAAPLAGDEPRGGQAEDPVALVVDRIDMSGSRVGRPDLGAAGTHGTEHGGRVLRGGARLSGPPSGGGGDELEDIDEF